MSFKEPENQVARWLEILSQFNFKIVHRACLHTLQTMLHVTALLFLAQITTSVLECWPSVKTVTREHLEKEGVRQKRDYDARLSQNNYQVGDLVYYTDSIKKMGKSPKLNPKKWIGPYILLLKSLAIYCLKSALSKKEDGRFYITTV